jgi:SNF2 family DNA or RNA helicase
MTRRDYSPRPYQSMIVEHIHNVDRCAVWAGMGMGKTISTLTALDGLFLAGEDHPVLALAPLRVARTTWPDEARKWSHLRHVSVMPIVGDEKERRAALRTTRACTRRTTKTCRGSWSTTASAGRFAR